MKRIVTLSIILVFAATALLSAKEEKVSEEDKIRIQIQELLQKIKSNNKKAQDLFDEAKTESDNYKMEVDEKLAFLDKALIKADKSKVINREKLHNAKKLHGEAKAFYEKHNYKKSLEVTKEALGLISNVPIVSLEVTPQVFSPNTDELAMVPDVYSDKPVKSWKLSIKKLADTEEIEVHTFNGSGNPPEKITWDGKLNMKVAVDSATDYNVELKVADDEGGVGSSGNIHFKTEIFTTRTPRGLLINVSSINFDSNKANLKDRYKPIVTLVYNFLLEFPEYNIIVEGHTDNVGSAKSNITLSESRAQSVADYLVFLGMDQKRIKTRGLGENLPATIIYAKKGLNRRVSFILLKDEKDLATYDDFVNKIDFTKELKMKR